MAFFFASWWTEFYFSIFLGVLAYYAYFKIVIANHWKNRNITFENPVFVLGNLWQASLTRNFAFVIYNLHKKWKSSKLVGVWSFSNPVLIATDLELIKKILATDFSHFRNHGFNLDFEREPLAGHLFNLKNTKWRNLRVKLTPTFTSGKMKMMYPIMVECGRELQDYLKGVVESKKSVEVKEFLARFTTDIIGSCAFGIQTNSLKNPDSEFRKYGKKMFEPNLTLILVNLIFNFSPKLFNLLKLRIFPKDVSDFFLNAVRETIEYREQNNVKANDFMQLLIQLKNKGKLEDVDGVIPTIPDEELSTQVEDMKFSFNEAAAQAFVFFAAGFETSSTLMTFALYELAINPDIQSKLQDNIDMTLAKYHGEMTYEAIMDMEYLDMTIQETLRKHPPIPVLLRECNKDYEIPELMAKIENKTQIFISVLGIHWDPEIFPNPEKFDPNRFSKEEKAKRDNFTSLHFGEGPRICIGNRFGLLQSKVGLASILSQYNVRVSNQTPIPLKYDVKNFILSPEGGMYLKLEHRDKKSVFV